MLKNILVTGAAGFIGANFVHQQLKRNEKITLISLDKLTYAGNLKNLAAVLNHPQHQFIQGDICDRALIDYLLRSHAIDTIVHFAAESHVDNSIKDPAVFVQTNVLGTFTLLESARHYWLNTAQLTTSHCRFHHVSTDEVFGSLRKEDPAFTETTAYAPNSPYSATKAGADHLARAYYQTYGLPVTISNCSNNYGPYQHAEKLIPTVIQACIQQRPIPVYGNGLNIRDWLYVIDHTDAINVILQRGQLGEVYNIGANNEWTNNELIHFICAKMDNCLPRSDGQSYKKLINFISDRPGHDFRYATNNHKIKQLGWQPHHSLEQGIEQTIAFYTQNVERILSP